MKKGNVTFEWKNFVKPTPTNLLFLVEGLKGIIGTVAISTYVTGNEKIAFWILIAGAALDFVTKVLARAAEGEKQVTTVSVPSELADQVEIKTEIKNES